MRAESGGRLTIGNYIPHVGIALPEISDLTNEDRDSTLETLDDVLQESGKFWGSVSTSHPLPRSVAYWRARFGGTGKAVHRRFP